MKKVFVLLFLVVATMSVRASDNFSDLRDELVSRAGILTNSIDKTEQKAGKACVKAIATLDKSIDLAGDIKAGPKVAKTLIKAFPSEFGLSSLLAASAVFTNNLQNLLTAGFTNI